MASAEEPDPLAGSAAALFRYLHELQKLNSEDPRSSEKYKSGGGLVLPLDDLPAHEAVRITHADADTPECERVVDIDRIPVAPPPDVPPELRSFIKGDVTDASSQLELVGDEADPGRQTRFDPWHAAWTSWALGEKQHNAVRNLYALLFAAREQITVAPQDWEFVLGIGRLQWQTGSAPIDRHIVVIPLSIELHADSGVISLRPAADAEPAVELDMLDPEQISDPAAERDLLRRVEERGQRHPLFAEQWTAALRGFVHAALAEGSFQATPPDHAATPVVSFSPAVVLRKRSRSALREALRSIADDLESCRRLPDGIRALVDPDAVRVPESLAATREGGAAHVVDDSLFLPLPVNAAQLDVLNRADSRPLTLVQGPPGTGKTHTAAVLIAHFLAQGKRILVTAHTEQALKEVRDKLPDDIKELAVSVLGSGRDEMNTLRAAVNAISNRAQQFDATRNQHAIDAAMHRIGAAERRRAQLRNDLISAGERESTSHGTPFGSGRYGELAAEVLRRESECPWAAELLPDATFDQPAPSSELCQEFVQLCRWRRSTTLESEVAALPALVPPLPDLSQLARLFEQLDAARRAVYGDYRDGDVPAAVALVLERDHEQRALLRRQLDDLNTARDGLANRAEPWLEAAVVDVLYDRAQQWYARRERIGHLLNQAGTLLPEATAQGPVHVDGSSAELRPMIRQLLEYTKSGPIKLNSRGGPKLGAFTPRVVKSCAAVFDAARIGGRPPVGHEDFQALEAHFELTDVLNYLDATWSVDTSGARESTQVERIAWHSEEFVVLNAALALLPHVTSVRATLAALALRVNLADDRQVAELRRAIDVVQRRCDFQAASRQVSELADRLTAAGQGAGSLVQLADAIRSADIRRTQAARRHLGAVLEARAKLSRWQELRDALSRYPAFVAALEDAPDDEAWDVRLPQLESAWRVCAARNLIEGRARFDPNAMQLEIAKLDVSIRGLVSEISGRRAWAAAVGRLTQTRKADLQYYAQLVRQLGKGTGKRASQLQADIRVALRNCREAVPVWIMPLYKVAESQQMTMNAFDVVIVDEASQAGLEALFLQYLAPKMVIVGDDKQVSPSAVGVQVNRVAALGNRLLAGYRYKAAWQNPQRSLFDEAKMRYPDLITLREHRRCVPDIIGFSNEIAYLPDGVPLIPVREPGASALEPIVTRFCADGYQQGGSGTHQNPVEADAIVAEIEKMVADPAYDDKTIGVISLLGKRQAELIERKLLDVLPAEELVSREIRCGDSASFQGSERDVILLSMVAAPSDDRRLVALTGQQYLQRYNVAASRAKDQMWLFYSVPRQILGNPEDMRFCLIEYCERVAARRGTGIPGAVTEPVPHDVLVKPPFESLFEQRVCNALVTRGFVVVPQYKSLGYRIDLVVIGAHGKLAVECDGDFWHGPERFGADLARQRDLERCGWTFIRVLESDFYLDQIAALVPLFERLDEMDILPRAAIPAHRLSEQSGSPEPPQQRSSSLPSARLVRQPPGSRPDEIRQPLASTAYDHVKTNGEQAALDVVAPPPPPAQRIPAAPDHTAVRSNASQSGLLRAADSAEVESPALGSMSDPGLTPEQAREIDVFLLTPTYRSARAAAGWAALPDDRVAAALRLLLAGSGRASRVDLADALGVRLARLHLALASLRRLLNVDGYPVIALDADDRNVLLDEPLWRQQFGLPS